MRVRNWADHRTEPQSMYCTPPQYPALLESGLNISRKNRWSDDWKGKRTMQTRPKKKGIRQPPLDRLIVCKLKTTRFVVELSESKGALNGSVAQNATYPSGNSESERVAFIRWIYESPLWIIMVLAAYLSLRYSMSIPEGQINWLSPRPKSLPIWMSSLSR